MIEKILDGQDYRKIIKNCISRKSSYAIKDYVASVIKAYQSSNINLILNLIENMEVMYPRLEGTLDGTNRDFLNFEEVKKDFGSMYKYVYRYLIYLHQKRSLPKSPEFNLVCKFDKHEILSKLHLLKKNGFCTFTSAQKVKWIFVSGNGSGDRIRWIGFKPNRPHYQSLFHFLTIVMSPDIRVQNATSVCNWVMKTFLDANSKEFSIDNLKAHLKRFKRNRSSEKFSELDALLKIATQGHNN
jgi:hypothetical protein